ncbi:MAG TPA: LPS export ABC transporter permease LptF [Xanthobacteraceae bacterium]|nr:LPS export ABC transporter permease LptF [Xanthobacteraceae bacterium]
MDRYILVTAGAAFLAALLTLTGMVWLTQILRRFDLLTNQGQSVWIFLIITSLALPTLLLLTAPIATFLSVTYTLNKFGGDSELIVMSASGMSPWQIFKPLAIFTAVVMLLSALISIYVGPLSVRTLREQMSAVTADIVSNIAQPGRFATITKGLTFHIRERDSNGVLRGIFVNDARDANAMTTYVADRGQIVSSDAGIFLVLEHGTMHRSAPQARNATMVNFERYAFDMSQLTGGKAAESRASDRPLSELLNPEIKNDDADAVRQEESRIRVELHKRLSTPLYPLAAFVIPFAFLGLPRTTRQTRGASMAGAGFVFLVIELAGFGTWGFVQRNAIAWPLPYIVPISAIVPAVLACTGVFEFSMPPSLQKHIDAISARLQAMQEA